MSKSPFGQFPCPNCEAIFTLKANRKRHIDRKHTQRTQTQKQQQERYQCAICKKKYSSKCYLRDHISIVHQHDKTILSECKICFKKFSSRNAARDHQQYMHNISPVQMFTCDHCNRQFNKKHNMQVHIMYSPCNPFRIIRKKIQCPHCRIKCLENNAVNHIRMCAIKKGMGTPTKPQQRRPMKQKVTEKSKRKTESGNFKNTMLGENIDCLNISVKVEDIDENEMEDVATNSNATKNMLRRSNRKRKRVDYQVLNGDVVTDTELTQFYNPLGIQEIFRKNDYAIKLEATESELTTLDMDKPEVDIMNCDSEATQNCMSLNSEDISSVFSSNILINSTISYSVSEDLSNFAKVSLDGVSNEENNTIISTNVLDDKNIVMKENPEGIDVIYHNVSSNDVEIQPQEIKNEQLEPTTETYENNNQKKALKQEIETDLATEIVKEEEELMKSIRTDLATSEIYEHNYDEKSETMNDIRFYKYFGII